MTVAKAMKSPGQKLKSPKGNGPATPKLKSPKGKGPATPKGTPSVMKTPKGTPNVAKTPKGTPALAKTPKGTPALAKTPKGTPAAAKTPKGTPAAAKTPKGTPAVAKTPKGTPAVAKTPKGTPAVAKTPKGTPAVAKSPKGTPNVAKSAAATPKAGTPKVVQPKSLKRPHSDLTTLDKNNIIFRRLRINNVNVKDSATISKIRELLSPYGEIQEIIRDKESLLVVFETSQEARAAQKLNGVLCDGQHVTISHIDAKRLPIDHKVTLYNLPKEFCDHDAWAVFGSCGKIANIGMNRDWRTKQIIRCNLVFETAAGAKAALSMGTKEIHGQQVRILEYQTNIAFPVENTVYIPNLPLGIHEQDLLPFMQKAGPVTGVKISSSDKKRHALIYMTNAADVEKALKLSGSSVKNAPVTITRHKRSPLAQNEKKKPNSLVEIPVKKQKLNNGTTKAQQTKAVAPVKVEDDDDDASDSDASEASEADMLAAFQDRLQKLNDAESGEDDDDDDDDEDEDEEDGEDGSEEEDDDEDGSEEDEDGSDEDDDEDDDE